MTPKEILNKLSDICAFDVKLYGALINAIEKQIPQKIKREPHICLHSSNLLHYTYHCPVCGALVKDREGWNYPNEKEDYCYRCGQRLDWGETK